MPRGTRCCIAAIGVHAVELGADTNIESLPLPSPLRRHAGRQAVTLGRLRSTLSIILAAKGREVASVEPNATLSSVVALLAERRIGAALILGVDRRLVGIVSEPRYCACARRAWRRRAR